METKETIIKERKIVTFKEVHQELENESLFLKKNHDIAGYKEKSKFLNGAGFYNSIAAKLYSSISEHSHMIDEYEKKYLGQYKFILKPQLERLCEKYNLFVRLPDYFLGDIPENNVREMMNFQVYLEDLEAPDAETQRGYRNWDLYHAWNNFSNKNSSTEDREKSKNILLDWMKKNEEFINFSGTNIHAHSLEAMHVYDPRKGAKVKLNDLKNLEFEGAVQIAAVEGLFAPSAFMKGNTARVPGRAELVARHQVDLDPIVLCETRHGYIVVTAWGDEANDELIFNQNKN